MPLSKPKLDFLLAAVLAVVVVVVFSPVRDFEFINFDDNVCVTDNVWVQQGLTASSIRWAFTTFRDANWYPLTWLSHELDCELFGLNPSAHHAVAVLLHAACTVLLFLFLCRTTAHRWTSAFVAALFALHPLHVESVAWVSERKDVLSTLFFMATLHVYARYARTGSVGVYLAAILLFALGLLSKPMLVTLPFVLLLLDYWPLNRWPGAQQNTTPPRSLVSLVVEKIPFFVLSFASCVMTLYAQHRGGAMESTLVSPISQRLANAVVAYATYIQQMLVPRNLALIYPRHEEALNAVSIVFSILLLAGLTLGAFFARRKVPHLLVGWLWYLGTLVPVIGIVQVGSQAYADRYTYIPIIGLLIAAAWGFSELAARRPSSKPILVVLACAVLVILTGLTRVQLSHWRTSETIFAHTLAVTYDNPRAHDYFGQALLDQGRVEESLEHFQHSIRLEPTNHQPRYNLGVALERSGDIESARKTYRDAIALRPDHFSSHYNLGVIAMGEGELEESQSRFIRAIDLKPESLKARTNLGIVMGMRGQAQAARRIFTDGLALYPQDADLHVNLAVLLYNQNDYAAAQDHLFEAIASRPGDAVARRYLALVQRAMESQKGVAVH